MRVICEAVLGVPCLKLRDDTGRLVTITEGTTRLVSKEADRIVRAAREVLAAPPPRPRRPALGDGQGRPAYSGPPGGQT